MRRKKREGQDAAGAARPTLAGVAGRFADYAVAVLEGPGSSADSPEQQTPKTALRPGKSVIDALRWNAEAAVGTVARKPKRQKTNDDNQTFLDFGQKNFYTTRCKVCDMYYCPGLASDEKLHQEFHKRITQGIVYKGFKAQHTVSTFPDGSYIVCVRSNDPAPHLAKAAEVRQMAERELGGFGCVLDDASVQFLMVSAERRVVGYLLAERIRRAYRVVTAPTHAETSAHAVEEEGRISCAAPRSEARSDEPIAAAAAASSQPHGSVESLVESEPCPATGAIKGMVALAQGGPCSSLPQSDCEAGVHARPESLEHDTLPLNIPKASPQRPRERSCAPHLSLVNSRGFDGVRSSLADEKDGHTDECLLAQQRHDVGDDTFGDTNVRVKGSSPVARQDTDCCLQSEVARGVVHVAEVASDAAPATPTKEPRDPTQSVETAASPAIKPQATDKPLLCDAPRLTDKAQAQRGGASSPGSAVASSAGSTAWDENYKLLLEFRERFSHSCPQQHCPVFGPKFGAWAHNQRSLANRGLLRNDRVEQLKAIGFVFDGAEARRVRQLTEQQQGQQQDHELALPQADGAGVADSDDEDDLFDVDLDALEAAADAGVMQRATEAHGPGDTGEPCKTRLETPAQPQQRAILERGKTWQVERPESASVSATNELCGFGCDAAEASVTSPRMLDHQSSSHGAVASAGATTVSASRAQDTAAADNTWPHPNEGHESGINMSPGEALVAATAAEPEAEEPAPGLPQDAWMHGRIARDVPESPGGGEGGHAQNQRDAAKVHSCREVEEVVERIVREAVAAAAGAASAEGGDKAEAALEEDEEQGAAVVDIDEDEETLMVSKAEEPATCGICLVWVHRGHRRRGLGTRLLRAALQHSGLNHGSLVAPSHVAFSQPTPAGRKLAANFLGTTHFLVYRSTD